MKLHNITDREMSWLSFNQRVLELAEDPTMPLLERVRFLAIFSSNLDEFFMVRVATLMSKLENGVTAADVAGLTPMELMKQVSLRTNALMERQSKVYHKEMVFEPTSRTPNLTGITYWPASPGLSISNFSQLLP